MNYGLTTTPCLKPNECLVLGLFSESPFPDFVTRLDQEQNQLITRLFAKLTEAGDLLCQNDIQGSSLMLIHCGKQADFNVKQLNKRLGDIYSALTNQKIATATLCLPTINQHDADWQLQQMLLSIENLHYQLDEFKTKNNKKSALEAITFYLPGADAKTIHTAESIAAGVNLTRRLADLPANICTPSYLAEQAKKLTKDSANLSCQVMGPEKMRELGMGSLLAVAQGSVEEPRLIEVHYQGNGKAAPIVLVGKGITFDSGGISLKPAGAMEEMKYDMAGAASVLGTIKACAEMKLPVNLIGLLACAENLPSGHAVKPGDIVKSMSGQTIEIVNTDAEGRLVLADALTYAERFNPAFVVDLATLTGAMVIALGGVTTGFMTKDDALAAALTAASEASADKAWRMPLDDDYQEAIDSPLADMLNSTFDRSAGSITAACFLSRFTQKYRWAHMDIAGTAWVSGKKRHATGRPVPLLIELIRHAANSR